MRGGDGWRGRGVGFKALVYNLNGETVAERINGT